jgi:hypothetical protein
LEDHEGVWGLSLISGTEGFRNTALRKEIIQENWVHESMFAKKKEHAAIFQTHQTPSSGYYGGSDSHLAGRHVGWNLQTHPSVYPPAARSLPLGTPLLSNCSRRATTSARCSLTWSQAWGVARSQGHQNHHDPHPCAPARRGYREKSPGRLSFITNL